ncbi:ROK family transcriptional regulator [Paenibacillus paridis]|uniref:ROK family transcriptional regulator n=1 Tax=Paenibacillus paridis TaxID=2583376 RepID=UPI0011206526|nr:ROK family transcriptional regulator [Paenibacillus paridis]
MQKGDSNYIRGLNDQLILDIIFKQGRISRAEVSRLAELSKPTVSSSVQRLIDKGLVREVGRGENAQGRKATLLEFNYSAYYVCGIDVGAKKARIALSRPDSSLLDYEELETEGAEPHIFMPKLQEVINRLIGRQGTQWGMVPYIAVAMPSVVVPETGQASLMLNELKKYEHSFTRESLEKLFATRVLVENDVNLATMAEQSSGTAKETPLFVYLSVGAGVGAGLVVEGQLVRGLGGAAGEIGHMRLGREGRVEELLSSGGLQRIAHNCLEDSSQPSLLREYLEITPAVLFEAARMGDELAISITEEYGELLAAVIHNVSVMIAPELIVLGGEIGSYADVLLPVVAKHTDLRFPIRPLLTGSILGETAVVLGAVNLAARHAYEQIRNELVNL